jgi:hypothetical protein
VFVSVAQSSGSDRRFEGIHYGNPVPRRAFWIADLRISEAIELKLRERRGLTGETVRLACMPDAYDDARWEDHPIHGMRLLVTCRTLSGDRLKVILQPVDIDEGIWRLRTVLR